jgi:hypothetical protein
MLLVDNLNYKEIIVQIEFSNLFSQPTNFIPKLAIFDL